MEKLEKIQDTIQETAQRLDVITANLEATQDYVEGVSGQVTELLQQVSAIAACQEQIMEQINALKDEIREGNKAIIQLSMGLSKRVDRLEKKVASMDLQQAVGV